MRLNIFVKRFITDVGQDTTTRNSPGSGNYHCPCNEFICSSLDSTTLRKTFPESKGLIFHFKTKRPTNATDRWEIKLKMLSEKELTTYTIIRHIISRVGQYGTTRRVLQKRHFHLCRVFTVFFSCLKFLFRVTC